MVLHTKDNLADYVQHLKRDRAEVEALYQDILINVTSFFREPETFEALKESVFPEILKTKNADTPIRLWVPGCSTGQEAYSLAIALVEFLETQPVRPPIQIFATDLSETGSLVKAREGVYPENIEAEVSPERLRRFFTKEQETYRINKSIRDLCVFARQNVAADPPFSHLDLISCRNVLIYLTPVLQKRVIPTFHYALNPERLPRAGGLGDGRLVRRPVRRGGPEVPHLRQEGGGAAAIPALPRQGHAHGGACRRSSSPRCPPRRRTGSMRPTPSC